MLEFLKAWLKWATEDGAPDGDPFSRGVGLCCALYPQGVWPVDEGDLHRLFKEDGLSLKYPFGEDAYFDCLDDDTMHQDPNRLA